MTWCRKGSMVEAWARGRWKYLQSNPGYMLIFGAGKGFRRVLTVWKTCGGGRRPCVGRERGGHASRQFAGGETW